MLKKTTLVKLCIRLQYIYSKTSLNRTLLFQKVVQFSKNFGLDEMSDCPRKPNEVRIMGKLFGCVGTQAASKSEHCSDSALLNRNLFGFREGTQVNRNIVRIAPSPPPPPPA